MSLNPPDHSLDHQSVSELMIGLSATLGTITTVIVILRMYTRLVQLRNAGSDDLMIAVTQILAIGVNICTALEGYYGTGRHWWLSSPDQLMSQLKTLFSVIQLYIWGLCCVKISLLLQYRRIFMAAWLQRLSVIIICFSTSWNVVQSILVSLGCTPLSNIIPSLASHCIDSLTVWYVAAGINITTDFIVFLLPIPLINTLQLPIRQKVLLILVFCLGFFTCVISIVRATKLRDAVYAGDPSFYGAPAAIWSMVELNCAILCACLPTVRHLFASWLPWLGLRTARGDRSGMYYAGDGRAPSSSGPSRKRPSVFGGVRGGGGSRKARGASLHHHHGPGFAKGSKGSGDSEGVVSSHGGSRHGGGDIELETTWGGGDVESDGGLYHNNNISAWVSAQEPKSPARAKVRHAAAGGAGSDDGAGGGRRNSESRLIGSTVSDEQLRTNILVTSEVRVEEGPLTTTPSPRGRAFPGVAL